MGTTQEAGVRKVQTKGRYQKQTPRSNFTKSCRISHTLTHPLLKQNPANWSDQPYDAAVVCEGPAADGWFQDK